MADKSQLCFPAFVRDNTPRQSGDDGESDDDPDESHTPVSSFESRFATVGGYWMGSLEPVQNETTAE